MMKRQADLLRGKLASVLHVPPDWPGLDFLISSLTEYNPVYSTNEIKDWLEEKRRSRTVHVDRLPLSEMRQWRFHPETGDLEHDSGGFFAIRGLHARANLGPVKEWTQPIMDQPQIGLLGMLAKKIGGILYLLIQAKAEPGNLGGVQLAPTVQATRSNFTRVHGGKTTPYLEYFLEAGRAQILFDQHQSEQGARFYRKRNRNIIVQVREDERIEPHPDFRWVTLGQLKRLMLQDDTVNMDARSVISTISFCPEHGLALQPIKADDLRDCLAASALIDQPPNDLGLALLLSGCSSVPAQQNLEEVLRLFSREKFQAELDTRLIPLSQVKDWSVEAQEIRHLRDLYFSIIGIRVASESREVSSWDQPIMQQRHPGIIGFILRRINGVVHFLVQLKMESGNIDLLGVAPTVQCITGSYEVGELPPFVSEMLQPRHSKIIFDTMQSEEGGRFYLESNRNLLLLADDDFPLETPPRYLWLSLQQMKQLLAYNNFLNVEARSLLALL